MIQFLIKQFKIGVLILGFSSNIILAQNFQIINFNKKDYKAANQNGQAAKGKDGTVFYANNFGLLEFDGSNWKLHPSPNATILRTIKHFNGKVYTAGYKEFGYWIKKSSESYEYISLSDKIDSIFEENEEFWNIVCLEKENKIAFQSFSNFYILDNGSIIKIKVNGFINYSTQINDELIFTINQKGIYKVKDNSYLPIFESTFFNNKTINFLTSTDITDELIVVTKNSGIFLLSDNEITDWPSELNGFLASKQILNGFAQNNKLYFGTVLDGLFILNQEGELLEHINQKDGLQSNTVLSIFIDDYSNIWLSVGKGIDFIYQQTEHSFKYFMNKDIGAIYTAALYNNNLYVGTNQGLYYKEWGDNRSDFELIPGTEEQIFECKVIDDVLFIGHNKGTFSINKGEINKISSYAGGYCIKQIPNKHDMLIQSTYYDLVLYKKTNNSWNYYSRNKEFFNVLRFIEFDHLHNLWASHLHDGIFRIVLNDNYEGINHVRHYKKKEYFDSTRINPGIFKVENRLVITTGDLLYTYNDLNDTIITYDYLNKHLKSYKRATRIIKGPKHTYWFISELGVACFYINLKEINLIKEFPTSLFKNQLIPNYENVIPLSPNSALVCLEDGYAILNTQTINEGAEIGRFKPKLESVFSFSNKGYELEEDFTKKITLPYNRNNLILTYSFPLYSSHNRRYQYKIEGLNEKWSVLNDESTINLRRLNVGEFTLHFRVMNEWGNFSEIISTEFKVTPPWYRTIIAYFIYYVILVLSVLRIRSVTIKKVKLRELAKRKRTEQELTKVKNENLQLEITSKSQQLANSTMGIIKKNEFLFSLKERLKRQKESLGSRYPDKYYDDIVGKIDEHITGKDDWKVFESNFVQTHETFLKDLKNLYPELTPSDLRLCAYLRINLTSKEIAPMLGVTIRSVENHRSRIRKKLNLEHEDNLSEFIIKF